MTSPSADSIVAPAPVKPASRWEDFMDIFYAPKTVYERRQNQSPWPTIFIVTILITIITLLTFNAISPVVETEMRQANTKALAKNPQATADMVEKMLPMQMAARKWGVIGFPIGVLILAIFVWLVARIVGAKETYGGALVVLAYSSIIAVVQTLIVGAQGLVMNVSNLTSMDQLSLSAARFADKATTSPVLYAILKQIDIFGIWGLIVMAIGVEVTAKTTRQKAITFAVVWFVLVTVIAALVGWRQAA